MRIYLSHPSFWALILPKLAARADIIKRVSQRVKQFKHVAARHFVWLDAISQIKWKPGNKVETVPAARVKKRLLFEPVHRATPSAAAAAAAASCGTHAPPNRANLDSRCSHI